MRGKVNKAILHILAIFLVCELAKDFEFLVLKTDQSFLAENIFCKLFAIAVILFCLRKQRLSWGDIGFQKSGVLRGAVFGFTLGAVTFFVSYLVEILILHSMGLRPRFSFYVSNFTISGQNIIGGSAAALVICILGNLINVWAEEGLFRGLLLHIGKKSFSPKTSNLIQSLLFGLWHVITVVVWVLDGSIDLPAALVMSVGYVALAGILGYEWGLCAALTGTLWTGAFEHFFNNFVSNTIHVFSDTGVDELQIVRIVISNTLSLLIVVALTKRRVQGDAPRRVKA